MYTPRLFFIWLINCKIMSQLLVAVPKFRRYPFLLLLPSPKKSYDASYLGINFKPSDTLTSKMGDWSKSIRILIGTRDINQNPTRNPSKSIGISIGTQIINVSRGHDAIHARSERHKIGCLMQIQIKFILSVAVHGHRACQ